MEQLRHIPVAATPRVYDQIAQRYGILHERFLRLSGGEAQSALVGALTPMLRPGLRVLDAGCGDGSLAGHLLSVEPALAMTMLDTSPRMMERSARIAARRVHGSIEALPFRDASFDVAIAAWVIETRPDPAASLRELSRVTRGGGWVCLAFCAKRADADLVDRLTALAMKARRTGRFLDPDVVRNGLAEAGAASIRTVPCRGPTVAMLACKERVQ